MASFSHSISKISIICCGSLYLCLLFLAKSICSFA
nr:MAG TPA: hypothetical protein [Caudoviricetes sp.]DAR22369.1 MAG TPA: hypothetical protein [Caudoviricetes sp.]